MEKTKVEDLNNHVITQIEQLQDKYLTIDQIHEEVENAKIISVLTSPEIKSAKKCPICNERKTLDNFYRYYNKATNKFMHTTYCDPCAKIKRSIAAKKRYQKNRAEVLIKVKKYRKENADKIREYEARNKDKIKKTKSEYRKKYVKNLETPYVAALIAQKKKCSIKEVYEFPELIEAHRNYIKSKRLTRNYGKK